MDPRSEVLSLLRLTTYVAGGFAVETGIRLEFQRHEGMKCYAVISGSCWVSVDGTPDAVLLETGDCILLPCGLPFCLATDLAGPRVAFSPELANHRTPEAISPETARTASILGGHFLLSDGHFKAMLHSLPPIVHLRRAAHSKVMRWSLECLQEEVHVPQPGG